MRGRLLVFGVAALGALGIFGGMALWRGVHDRGQRIGEVSWLDGHLLWERLEASGQTELRNALDEVSKTPRRGESWGSVAVLLDECGYTEEALPFYRRAEELRPDAPRWPDRRARALERLGRTQPASQCWRRLATLRPEDAYIRLRLGDLFLKLGNLDRAAHHFETALLLDPNNSRARLALGETKLQRESASAASVRGGEHAPKSRTDPARD